VIVADPRNERARELAEGLRQRLPEGWAPPDLRLVLGGDGFMLRTIAEYGVGFVFLGLNAGHLGFLLNDVDGDLDALVARLVAGQWREYRFPRLHTAVTKRDGQVAHDIAINDVYLERSTGQTAHVSVTIDGTLLHEDLAADGLILATALGSTAYNFSAGGTAAHPEVPVLLVTPICPHRPRLPPVILPASVIAEVEVLTPFRRPVRAVADGRAIEDVAHIVVRQSEPVVRLAWLHPHDFTRHLVHKILKP
jgi:NAD+ kinase